MPASRLPAHLEVSALLRQVNGAGGFATVLHKGDREAGTVLVVLAENGGNLRIFERMPQTDGTRKWTMAKAQTHDNAAELQDWLGRRSAQDPDLWIIELDIADGERFIRLS